MAHKNSFQRNTIHIAGKHFSFNTICLPLSLRDFFEVASSNFHICSLLKIETDAARQFH